MMSLSYFLYYSIMSTPNESALTLVKFLLSPQETVPNTVIDENCVFLLSHHLRGQIEQTLDKG